MIDRSKYLPKREITTEKDIFLLFSEHVNLHGQVDQFLISTHKNIESAEKAFVKILEEGFPRHKELSIEEKDIIIDQLDYYDNSNGDALYVRAKWLNG